MSTMFKVLTLAAALCVAAPLALASSITIESYGTNLNDGSPNPLTGIGNAALQFVPDASQGQGTATSTFNIPTYSPWIDLSNLSNSSSWISFDPNTYVGGSNTGPDTPLDGTYTYVTTFSANAGDVGSITVLADDTTSVSLNGHTFITAGSTEATNCTSETPNCVKSVTIGMPADFLNGPNTLTFVVHQDFGYATGLDFVGTVGTPSSGGAVAPEPSSLFLLGTGLMTVVGAARRKLKA